MSEYLWTGESAFCHCGHHIKDHTTWNFILDPVFVCNGEDHEGLRRCNCKGFVPYKVIEEEKEG